MKAWVCGTKGVLLLILVNYINIIDGSVIKDQGCNVEFYFEFMAWQAVTTWAKRTDEKKISCFLLLSAQLIMNCRVDIQFDRKEFEGNRRACLCPYSISSK